MPRRARPVVCVVRALAGRVHVRGDDVHAAPRICAAQYAPAPTSSHRHACFNVARRGRWAAKAYRRHGHERHASRHARVRGDTREREACLSLASLFECFHTASAATTGRSHALLRRYNVARKSVLFSSRARANSRAPSRSLEWSTEANGLGSTRAFSTSACPSSAETRHAFSTAASTRRRGRFSHLLSPFPTQRATVRVRGVAPAARARVISHLEPRLVQRGRERDRAAVRDARIAACKKGFDPSPGLRRHRAPIIAARR